ncbi:hypothetical protein K2173_023233 [Erythroxylum novogranatense]|uniref:RWP-RK domain-containing protein n=1 Tax=Erythroxylum novogranatense TaxID=1862640 RepID=A0AAV8TA24_9ROSI|nr:hypothetical protein K2173_023233 [Erythroxylum novogranatense]
MSWRQQSVTAAEAGGGGGAQTLTLDVISEYFSLPLSDAANYLGVCVSVLKKICRENGLERWPYRKVLAGKSIEDILKSLDATSALGQGDAMSPQKVQQQQQQQGVTPSLTIIKGMDEFKYGFPPNGLSVASNRWWGTTATSGDADETHTHQDDKHQSENKMNDTSENGWKETETGAALLTAARERSAKEGREALKLRVHRSSYRGSKHKPLLLRIFGSSLPHI